MAHLGFSLTQKGIPVFWIPLQVLVQTFLCTGLFILSHECMHGNLRPISRLWQRRLGQLSLFLYAGFSFSKLEKAHWEHHDHPATEKDPDYTEGTNENFYVWLRSFVFRYFGLKEFAVLHIHVVAVYLISGNLLDIFLFFGIPSWLSALQLFYFGTYLPHRNWRGVGVDTLRARSNRLPVWLSFLTCFHFGYHREHHQHPRLPWWKLPQARWQGPNAWHLVP